MATKSGEGMSGTSSNRPQQSNMGNQQQGMGQPNLDKFLKDMKWPADKNTIINNLKKNNAPQEVIQMASRLENKQYTSAMEITKQLSMARR